MHLHATLACVWQCTLQEKKPSTSVNIQEPSLIIGWSCIETDILLLDIR